MSLCELALISRSNLLELCPTHRLPVIQLLTRHSLTFRSSYGFGTTRTLQEALSTSQKLVRSRTHTVTAYVLACTSTGHFSEFNVGPDHVGTWWYRSPSSPFTAGRNSSDPSRLTTPEPLPNYRLNLEPTPALSIPRDFESRFSSFHHRPLPFPHKRHGFLLSSIKARI